MPCLDRRSSSSPPASPRRGCRASRWPTSSATADDRPCLAPRRCAAGVGPVVVACAERRDRRRRRARRRQGGADRPDHPSGSDRVPRRSRSSIPAGGTTSWSTCRATCRRSIPRRSAPRSTPLADPAVDIATLAAPIARRGRARSPASVVKIAVGVRARRRVGRALYFSRTPDARRATGRTTTISASTPIAAPRWSASWRCRRRRSSSARGSSSCARSRPACASTWRSLTRVPLGVDTPADLARARALCSRRRHEQETRSRAATIAFQGAARRLFRSRLPRGAFRDLTTLPCAAFEDAFAAVRERHARALAMLPIENSVAGRVADIHHLCRAPASTSSASISSA